MFRRSEKLQRYRKAKIAMLFLILTVSVLLGMGKGVTPSWLYHNIGNKTLFSPFGFGVERDWERFCR